MSRSPIRLIAYASLFLIVTLLTLFTNLDHEIILSIALILVFLIIFTYIFKTNGPKTLKAALIVFIFIGLPIFILTYLDSKYHFGMLAGVMAVILASVFGILSIFTIVKLDYVEIKYVEGEDDE